jgi:hypothetical protein
MPPDGSPRNRFRRGNAKRLKLTKKRQKRQSACWLNFQGHSTEQREAAFRPPYTPREKAAKSPYLPVL